MQTVVRVSQPMSKMPLTHSICYIRYRKPEGCEKNKFIGTPWQASSIKINGMAVWNRISGPLNGSTFKPDPSLSHPMYGS